jgi:WhiB family redox-sensing transcriptional regulator
MTAKSFRIPEVPLPEGPEAYVAHDRWREEALCRKPGTNKALWFPDRSRGKGVAEALRICALCPVRTDCLEYALAAPEHHGIWGGMLEHERRIERRKREREAAIEQQRLSVMTLGPR